MNSNPFGMQQPGTTYLLLRTCYTWQHGLGTRVQVLGSKCSYQVIGTTYLVPDTWLKLLGDFVYSFVFARSGIIRFSKWSLVSRLIEWTLLVGFVYDI